MALSSRRALSVSRRLEAIDRVLSSCAPLPCSGGDGGGEEEAPPVFPSLGVTLALLRPGKTVSLCASREGFFGLFPFAAFAWDEASFLDGPEPLGQN